MALYEKEVGGVSARGYNWEVWGPAGVFFIAVGARGAVDMHN